MYVNCDQQLYVSVNTLWAVSPVTPKAPPAPAASATPTPCHAAAAAELRLFAH